MKQRLFLTFSAVRRDTPILSTLATKFELSFNVFGATIDEEKQCMALEIEGPEEKILAAVEFLKQSGVHFDQAES
ncbi:MAG: NIL domain-containing protein [Planctomycetota bacterium]